MRSMRRAGLPAFAAIMLTAAVPDVDIRRNATGDHDGFFHTFWHDGGRGHLTLTAGGYETVWKLEPGGNLVAGRGWRHGSTNRIVHYRARRFEPGRNGYLALYGWSKNPVVEYYVVDSWGGLEPPGSDAVSLGTVRSDGGTYRIYRARRIGQPSIAGTATFEQYWSVRTDRRPIGPVSTITFSNHVAAWRRLGLMLGRLDYQVLATEGFGSTGASTIDLWKSRENRSPDNH